MKLKPLILLALVVLTISLHSCKNDDETTPESSNTYPFPLTAMTTTNGVQLEWESLNISTFEQYVIVRSSDSIPDTAEPPFNLSISTISDQDETSFSDFNAPQAGDLYYKVFIQMKDRFVLSPTTKITSPSKVLPFCYYHSALIPNTNYIIISGSGNQIIKYDYVKHEVIAQATMSNQSNNVRVGDAGNGLELFVHANFNSSLFILDIDNLSIKETKHMGDRIFDVTASDKGFLFLTIENNTSSVQILDRSNMTLIDSEDQQPYYIQRRVVVSPKDDNRLLEISGSSISQYNFSDAGQFTAANTNNNISIGSIKRDVDFSADGNYFIAGDRTTIYDTESLSVSSEFEIYSPSHAFDSQNDNYIYVSDFQSVYRFDLSTEDFLILNSGIENSKIIDKGDQLILLGNGFFGFYNDCGYITVLDK